MAPINWRIQKRQETTSTNDDVRRAAEAGEGEGLVVVAERQTAGRGRQDRVWESPAGNLHCSALLRPKDMPRVAPLYSFVAALAVYDTLREFLPAKDITLKWPNDVLVGGKKISGILLESINGALIVGIGVNILHHPQNALYPATSLATEGVNSVNATVLCEKLLVKLGAWHDRMQNGGFGAVREAWLSHAQKGIMTVRLPHKTIQGEFVGLDETGHLRLLLADGTEQSISTGDVLFVPRDP